MIVSVDVPKTTAKQKGMTTQMRIETKFGLLSNAFGLTIGRIAVFPDIISGFFAGLFTGLGIFLMIVSLLPEKQYRNLLYRKWLANRKG